MIKFYVIYRLKAVASENFQPLFQKSSLKMHFPPEKCKKIKILYVQLRFWKKTRQHDFDLFTFKVKL